MSDAARDTGSSRRERARWITLAVSLAAALGVVQFVHPPAGLFRAAPFRDAKLVALPHAAPSRLAYGQSGEVKVRFALPGERVEYPLDVQGDPRGMAYQWVRLTDAAAVDSARPLGGADVVAPSAPGFYRLAVVKGAERRILDGITLSVLVPFTEKVGNTLNGYRIGTYLAERLGGTRAAPPEGFVEVRPKDLDLHITKHLTLADFVAHDGQDAWPRYAAVNPRLLDKLELVMTKVAAHRDAVRPSDAPLAVDVHSGFRPPLYNRLVKRSAQDSRHQYGDAADVTIDANGDGHYTLEDSRLVAAAVEQVEREHPELVGGMGLYTSRRYRTPYVHIDARGHRARWQG